MTGYSPARENARFRNAPVTAIGAGTATITLDGASVTASVYGSVTVGSTVLVLEQGGSLLALDIPGPPPGSVVQFAGSSAPSGWLLCQGQAVSRTTYAALFAVIGVTYGVGNGSTTFNVPNLKGRMPVGLDTAQTEFNTLGETGGAKTHTHTLAAGFAATTLTGSSPQILIQRVSGSWTPTHAITGVPSAAGSSAAQAQGAALGGTTDSGSSLPPYLTLHHIIKT